MYIVYQLCERVTFTMAMRNEAGCLVARTSILHSLYTTHNGQDICPLVTQVRVVAKELGFICLIGGFPKALVQIHACVDVDKLHC